MVAGALPRDPGIDDIDLAAITHCDEQFLVVDSAVWRLAKYCLSTAEAVVERCNAEFEDGIAWCPVVVDLDSMRRMAVAASFELLPENQEAAVEVDMETNDVAD